MPHEEKWVKRTIYKKQTYQFKITFGKDTFNLCFQNEENNKK